jgi:hypothetical protein
METIDIILYVGSTLTTVIQWAVGTVGENGPWLGQVADFTVQYLYKMRYQWGRRGALSHSSRYLSLWFGDLLIRS